MRTFRGRRMPVINGGTGIWSLVEVTGAAAVTAPAVTGGFPRRAKP
jgi:hypothetical protein